MRAAGAPDRGRLRHRHGDDPPAPDFQLAVHHAALRRGVLGITQEGKWVYRLQPALNQPIDLFRWSCERVAEAIEEVSANPPAE